MARIVSVRKLISQIRHEHEAALENASKAVEHVICCGQLLIALKASAPPGQWEALLSETSITKTTAWRYIRVAEHAPKKRGKFLLTQGASLVDLYRAFGLVKPCEGGGYRSEAYKQRKALAQLELDFQYEEFSTHVQTLVRARNVEQLAPSTLERLETDLSAALDRVRKIKSDKLTPVIEIAP